MSHSSLPGTVLSGQPCRQLPQWQGHTTLTVPAEPLTKSAVASWMPGSPATPAESGYGRGPAIEHVTLRGPRQGGAPLQTTAAAQILEASLSLEGAKGVVLGGGQAALHVRGQQVLVQLSLWRRVQACRQNDFFFFWEGSRCWGRSDPGTLPGSVWCEGSGHAAGLCCDEVTIVCRRLCLVKHLM